jgi:hypothetical protein
LWVRPDPSLTQQHETRLEGLPRINTLPYYENPSITSVKSFITLAPKLLLEVLAKVGGDVRNERVERRHESSVKREKVLTVAMDREERPVRTFEKCVTIIDIYVKGFFFFLFLLWPFTVLMKQTRHAVCAIKQSIFIMVPINLEDRFVSTKDI